MKKLLILSITVLCLLVAVNSAFAQSSSLTATVRVNPLEVEITAPSTVVVGERFIIEAEVSNLGQTRIKQTKARISFPEDTVLIKGKDEKNLGMLLNRRSKVRKWQATAVNEGALLITVVAEGGEVESGDIVTATDSVLINDFSSSTVSFFNLFLRLARFIR